jgi:hypothetical protein
MFGLSRFERNEEFFGKLEVPYSQAQDRELGHRLELARQKPQSFPKLERSLQPKMKEALAHNDKVTLEKCYRLMDEYLSIAAEVLNAEFETTLEVFKGNNPRAEFVVESGEDALLARGMPPARPSII